jgi:putative MATE family efflux protein
VNKPEAVSSKSILKLAVPAIIAGIAEPLINLTDVAFIGNMEQDAVASLLAVGLVGSFLSAVIWTLAQTKTSVSSIVSNALGAGNIAAVQTLLPQVIWINAVLGLLIYLITAPLASYIFSLYNAQGAVLDLSVSYYQVRALGFPITLSTFAIFGIFRGLQNTSWAMIASLCGAMVNIALDYLLVYGVGDAIPAMGVMGAAYASLVAQLTMLAIAVYHLYKHTAVRLNAVVRKPHALLVQHMRLTTNFFLRTVSINFAMFLSYRFATGYGKIPGATHAILVNIWLFFSFFIDGFASAGNAIGGRLLGSKDVEALRNLGKKTVTYGVGIACILVVLCFSLYGFIGSQFTKDTAILSLFMNSFWLVLLMQPVNAVAFVYDGIFKGWGEAVYLRNLLFLLTLLVFIPTLLLLDYLHFELLAIWGAFTLWMLGRAVVLAFKFHSRLRAL